MRVAETKIRFLAARLTVWLGTQAEVTLRGGDDAIAVEIARALRDDFRREDALDAEVEQVLLRHRRQIDREGADLERLRLKVKKQLAKERGIVL